MEFKSIRIYLIFRDAFQKQEEKSWIVFIEKLDIGLECLSYINDLYKITDYKKWLLTKIKYGL
jgi:hypothetical protein